MIIFDQLHFVQSDFSLRAHCQLPLQKIYAVLGQSGAGKTSFLNLLGAIEQPTSGALHIPAELGRAAFIFQDHNCFLHLSVFENVALGISPSLRLSKIQQQEVSQALAQVGLGGFETRRPATLSGGERQRIALARLLVQRSKLLLLDEPFAALDPAIRKAMLKTIRDLQKANNLTVFLVSHQPQEIANEIDAVLFVDDGTVQGPISKAKFFSKTAPLAVRRYLGN